MANKPCILLIASFLCFLLLASYAVANTSSETSKEVVPDKADPVIELVTNNPEVIDERSRSESPTRLEEARQCRLNRISPSRPRRRIQSEGGVTELWNEFEDQFQCTGVAPMRNIIRPNSLSLLNYSPAPRLVYIEQGRALLGLAIPGCPATYHSSRGGEQSLRHDDHQQVHRVQRGDIVLLPPGVPHWCLNDGNEDLVAVSVTHLNSQHNQLDQKLRSFYLAGGHDRESQSGSQYARETFQNILRAFDANLLAEALNVPVRTARNMQRERGEGFIVKARDEMRIIRPDEYQDEEREGRSRYREREEREGSRYGEGEEREGSRYREEAGRRENGIEEIACNMRFHYHMDDRREADVYSRHAGRLNIVNALKLPILSFVDLSAERGELFPDAIHAPHWTNNAHTIVYITRGEAQVQVVGNNGERIMDDRVRQGDMFSIPQYFASTIRAGSNGVEWVAFKTSAAPIKTTLAGANSAFRALPAQVIAVSYGISVEEALELKFGREKQVMLLPPIRSRSRSRGDMSN